MWAKSVVSETELLQMHNPDPKQNTDVHAFHTQIHRKQSDWERQVLCDPPSIMEVIHIFMNIGFVVSVLNILFFVSVLNILLWKAIPRWMSLAVVNPARWQGDCLVLQAVQPQFTSACPLLPSLASSCRCFELVRLQREKSKLSLLTCFLKKTTWILVSWWIFTSSKFVFSSFACVLIQIPLAFSVDRQSFKFKMMKVIS